MVIFSSCLIWQIISFILPPNEYGCVYACTMLITVVLNHWDGLCIKALVWCHTKVNRFRCWSQLTIHCVFASLSGPVIDLQKMPILEKKIIFSGETHFDFGDYVNKQNCRIWDTENPHAYIHKPTSQFLVRILVQRHNWAIFLPKWASTGHYSQWRSLSGHVKRTLVHKT